MKRKETFVQIISLLFILLWSYAAFSKLVALVGISAQNTMGGTKNSLQVSSTQDQKLVDNAPLGSAQSLNITYSIPAAESSSNKILGKPAGTYTQNITYTATVH